MRRIALVSALLLFSGIAGAVAEDSIRAPSCSPWVGLPIWCEPVLGSTYQTSTPYNQTFLASAINSTGLLMNFGNLNLTCMEALLNYICRATFPPCPSMIYPCDSTCLKIHSYCPDFLSAGFNCSSPNPCDDAYVALTPKQVCAYPPMVYSQSKQICDFHCPIPLYTPHEYDVMRFFQGICGWLGAPLSIFTILSYLLIPEFRFKHGVWFAIPSLCHQISVLHEVFQFQHIVCPADTGLDITNYVPCIIDGSFSTFGVTAGPLYFSCVAVDLALRLTVNPKPQVQKWLNIGYPVYAFGITTIALIVLLAKKNATSYAFFCSMSGANERLDNIFNTAPLVWSIFVGIVAMVIAMVQLGRMGTAFGGKQASRAFMYDLKLGLTLICYLPMPIIIASEQIWQQQGHIKSWSNAFGAWLNCIAQGMDPNCKLRDRLPYNILLLIIAAAALQGFSPFLLFALRKKILRWWLQMFSALVKLDVPTIKDTFSTKAGSDSGGRDSSRVLSRRTRGNDLQNDM